MSALALDLARIEAWTRANASGAFRVLPPVEPARIAALSARLGVTLPADLVELFAISEGGLPLCTTHPDAAWKLATIDRIVDDWTMFEKVARETPESGAWTRAWIPVANDGGGDWLCLDTAPQPGGTLGQVLFHDPGVAIPRVIAPSLASLFAAFADGLERAEYVYEPFVGIVPAPAE